MDREIMLECIGFEWDAGNLTKNWVKHQVSVHECEEVFFNQPLSVSQDIAHSNAEPRHYVLGKTNDGRELFIAFTIRLGRIRVISARNMSKKEREAYEKVSKNTKV